MGKIIRLPPEVSGKIAAGEVIERPASVVRELLDNAIDAGADYILCSVEEGGKRLILVQDNGIGIEIEDLPLALQRFATSKIHSEEDISKLTTLGFRGEALPSIGTVARMEISSTPQGKTTGARITMEGGDIGEPEPCAHPQGTTVIVRDLFYNHPARRKFLRSAHTEFRLIYQEIISRAIAFPEIAFQLYHNNKPILELSPAPDEGSRVQSIFGEDFFRTLLPIQAGHSPLHIYGFISKPEELTGGRGRQFLIVNRRAVIHKGITRTVYKAYGNPTSTLHPNFVIYIELPPSRVDVNVHPAKKEVRFQEEWEIHKLISKAVNSALHSGREEISKGYTPSQPIHFTPIPKGPEPTLPFTTPRETTKAEVEHLPAPSLFWQLHNTYIFAQTKSGVMIVDQHAASERIIFDRLQKSIEDKTPPVQMLLFPIHIDLPPDLHTLFLEIKGKMESVGFRFKEFSGNTIIIEGIPSGTRHFDEKDFLNLLKALSEDGKEMPLETLLKSIACHTAIRAGDPLTIKEMEQLINQLFATRVPYFCPHGRPIISNISLEELSRRFKR